MERVAGFVRRVAPWIVALAMTVSGVARAQDDDWAISRPDHPRARPLHTRPAGPRRTVAPDAAPSARLIDRYRAMVERDPSESFALTRWVTLTSERDGSTAPLSAEMSAARAADASAIVPRLVLAYLARRAGRLDEARTLYGEITAAHPDEIIGEAELARTEREAGALTVARSAYEIARHHAHGETATTLAHEELEVLVDLGDVDAATALDAELAGARPSVERRLELPRAWLAHQRPDAARAGLTAIEPRIAGDPRALVPVRMEIARADLALGHPADALSALDALFRSASGGLRVEAYELAYEAHRQASTLDGWVEQLSHERAPEALALLARVEDERGHDDAAIAAYDRAIRSRPRDTALRERRAHVLLRTGRVDEAASALEALWRMAPGEPDRLIEAASLLVDAGRRDDANALLTAASAARPRDVRLHQRLAEVFSRWGDEPRALAEAQALVRLDPSDTEHHAVVGDLLLARGDRAAAIAAFREMLTLDSSAAGHDRLAMALADHDLLDDARAELGEAMALAPDDRTTMSHMLEVLVRSGRDADAEPFATRLVTLSSSDPSLEREARAGLVSIWARRHTLERHVQTLESAFAATPPDLASGALLAESLRRSGSLSRAEEVLVRLATLRDDDAETWTTLERVRALRGDLAGAIEALDHAAHADPPRAAMYLARMSEDAHALYRDDDAVRYAEQALALAPNDAHGHVRLGDLFRRRQQTDAAIASYRRALALDADLHEVALTLAALTREHGDAEAADALYAHVIEQSPDDDLVSRAIDASLEIELARGSAEPLLDRLLTLSVAHYDRSVLSRSALAVLDVIASPLLPRVDDDAAARADLDRIAARGLGVLLRALASADPAEQRTALGILSAAHVEAAGPALLAASATHGDGSLGIDALVAAARVANADLVPRLLEIARGTDAPRARIASWSLARIDGVVATRALATLLNIDSDVAALAALGLARRGDEDIVPVLVRVAAHPVGAARRAAFLLALAALGHAPTSSECTSLTDAGGVARAVSLMTCNDDDAIARALLGGSDAAHAMRAATHVPTDLAVGWPEPQPGELPALLGLHAIDLAPRRAPSDALRHALSAVVREGLATGFAGPTVQALTVRDHRLSLAAFDSASVFDVASQDAVLDALPVSAGDPNVRASVARLLTTLRSSDARTPPLLADPDRDVARAALEGLGSAETIAPALAPTLGAILGGAPDWVSRLGAARALGRMSEGGEAPLVSALSSDDFAFVREAAAVALGTRSGDVGAAALRSAAESDPEERVRTVAQAVLLGRAACVR